MQEEEQKVETYHPSILFEKPYNILSIIAVTLFLFGMFYISFLSAPKDFPAGYIFDLKSGQTLSVVSDNLLKDKIIKSTFWFKSFIYIFSLGNTTIIEGDYAMKERQNVIEIAWRISQGKLNLIPLRITIPEGLNSYEIADLLSQNFPSFNKSIFLENIQTKKLEGYLFPDTYYIFPNMSESEIIKIMNDNFYQKIKNISEEIKRFGQSESDIIKMASILEEEARTLESREIIAGILWKRISIKMPLQVDASFRYINGKTTATLTSEDLKIDSTYNSYTRRGLPPTPISNPGLMAIKAAINPKASPYLYFLTGRDGQMYYATNFDQHIQNKFKYLK